MKEWNIDHELSSPRNPQSNGQVESAVKIVKGLFTRAKYSEQDPHLILLTYRSTPVDAHLHSPAEMLYQRTIQTTVPQRIRNQDPRADLDRNQLNDGAAQSASYHDKHSRTKSPFYAGQTVSVLNDAQTLWLPATVIRQAEHGSYLVEVIGGGKYHRAHDHIRERHPEVTRKADDASPSNIAPAMPEWPGAPPAHSLPAVPTTAPVVSATDPLPIAPTAKTSTPHKVAVCTPVQSPAPSTGVATGQTGAAPAAFSHSAHAHKPPTRLITQM